MQDARKLIWKKSTESRQRKAVNVNTAYFLNRFLVLDTRESTKTEHFVFISLIIQDLLIFKHI